MEVINKVIWIYWHQGWENAPHISRKCLETWILKNPEWDVIKLCNKTVNDYVDIKEELPDFHLKDITLASFSDILRVSLLYKYGGVWVDSTLLCRKPLNEWIDLYYEYGFFAFDKPGANRMVSSWFLMARKGNYILEQWYNKTIEFWKTRYSCKEYFWFHYQFNDLYTTDLKFAKCWGNTPKMSANAPHYFTPYKDTLFQNETPEEIKQIELVQSPVFKLTHKYDQERESEGTLISYLINQKQKTKKIKILVTWYGSFDKNGTIGDYLSLKSLLNFLSDNNFEYEYASYKDFDDLRGNRISLDNANPNDYQALIFSCGPITKKSKKLNSLIEKFNHLYKIGIGVSLFPKEHENYYNPFDYVLPRENGEINYEDIALIAPRTNVQMQSKAKEKELTVGVILRNKQPEYGIENCKDEESNSYIEKLANFLTAPKNNFFYQLFKKTKDRGNIINIDNHLETSNLSPQEIEEQYSQCDIILTTRFHGSMLALRNNIPFIAIDQISNGAKVYNLLSKNDYPFVWKINDVSFSKIKKSAMDLLNNKKYDVILSFKQNLELKAQKTLDSLYAHLLSFDPNN